MKRTCIIGIILKYSIILYMTTAVWSLLIAEGRLNTAVFLFQKIEIEKQTAPYTSTKYRHEKAFQGTLRRYRQFASLYCSEVSTAVPGLESTNVLGEACDRMVPQGICVAGDYMLITAYDNLKAFSKTKGKKQANPYHSVLYVLSNDDPEKRRLLTTIVLPDVNHVGGVTFDGKNVWIAKSTTQKCSVIPYGVIKDAANSGKESYKLAAYGQNVDCGAVASFLTFRQGKLWIGTYSNRASGTGRLRNYDIQKEDTLKGERYRLKLCQEIVIPGFANGVEFLEQGIIPIWRSRHQKEDALIPKFIYIGFLRILLREQASMIYTNAMNFLRWRKNWRMMEERCIFCLNPQPHVTAPKHI